VAGVDPELITEIAREPGTRHHELGAVEWKVGDAEGREFLDALTAHLAQYRTARRTLQRERGDLVRVLDDRDVEAERRARQPVELALLRAEPVVALAQVEDRAVVDDLAVVVAPDAVTDLAGLDLRDVARHEAVQERECVRPRNPVLRHRAQIEYGAGVADRCVLERLVEVGVGGRVVLPPVPLVQRVER
jgi:hypothetical protein